LVIAPALHFLGEFPGDDALDRRRGGFLAHAFLAEKIFEG
jgi:hypothetical protein